MDGYDTNIDNRQAFRVDALMSIACHTVHVDEIKDNFLATDDASTYSDELYNILEDLHKKSIPLLTKISQKDQDLSKYLQVLSNQVHLLGKLIFSTAVTMNAVPLDLQKVNISETGIAFGTDELYKTNDTLRLHFTIPDLEYECRVYAAVVKSTEFADNELMDANFKYWTACKFLDLPGEVAKKIACYILNKQRSKHNL